MKKFIVFIITAIIATSFTAKAQFTGGTATQAKSEGTIAVWDFFNKSFATDNDGYWYVNITQLPRESPEGALISTILTLSLGSTKDECKETLNAYKSLLNDMEKYEWREITDSKTNITYKIVKQGKGMLSFVGTITEKDKVVTHNNGVLTINDIDRMLEKL